MCSRLQRTGAHPCPSATAARVFLRAMRGSSKRHARRSDAPTSCSPILMRGFGFRSCHSRSRIVDQERVTDRLSYKDAISPGMASDYTPVTVSAEDYELLACFKRAVEDGRETLAASVAHRDYVGNAAGISAEPVSPPRNVVDPKLEAEWARIAPSLSPPPWKG